MCLCRKFNKRISPNALFQGRVVQLGNANYKKLASPQVMVKKTPTSYSKYLKGKKQDTKKAIVNPIAFYLD